MFRDKKDEENLVLLSLPPGKKYLTANEDTHQKGQKEGTCWYYTYSLLRPRIGKLDKLLGEVKEETKDPDVKALLATRSIEKILSDYRKQVTKLDAARRHEDQIAALVKTKDKVPEIVRQSKLLMDRIRQLKRMENGAELVSTLFPNLTEEKLQKEIQILEHFLKSEEATLKSYIENKYFRQVLKEIKFTLRKLGRDPQTELSEQIKRTRVDSDEEKLTLAEKALYYTSAIRRVAAEEYHLKYSNWHPADRFNELMKALTLEGPLAVGGMFGEPYYIDEAKQTGTLMDYDVFMWPKGAKKREDKDVAHVILLVGAQRIPTKSGLQDTVLFIDPNDESKPGTRRKIYRISYETLCNNIQNIYGKTNLKGDRSGLSDLHGPFAFRADPEYRKQLDEHYSNIKKRLAS